MGRTARFVAAATLGLTAGVIGYQMWLDLGLAAVIVLLAAGAITGGLELAGSTVRWQQAAAGLIGAALAAGVAIWAHGSWEQLWLTLVLAMVVGAGSTALLGFVAWLIRPYPVELDGVLGVGPADVPWRYRDSPRWRAFTGWVRRHGEGRHRPGAQELRGQP